MNKRQISNRFNQILQVTCNRNSMNASKPIVLKTDRKEVTHWSRKTTYPGITNHAYLFKKEPLILELALLEPQAWPKS